MDYEQYYGLDNYKKMCKAKCILEGIVENIKNTKEDNDELQRVVYYCSRIKKPKSVVAKLEQRGFKTDAESALNNIYDSIGIRVVCSFENDVRNVIEELERNEAFEVIEKKDYITFPKPNGYRSMHLCIRLKESGLLAEIQVRTIAMDFWATLEHQLKYKKSVTDEKLIKSELKRCADEIASVDISMQTIREILKEL